jgi:hypothetical protein
VLQEEQGAVVDAGCAGAESAVEAQLFVFAHHVFLLALPVHAERRVREEVVKALTMNWSSTNVSPN